VCLNRAGTCQAHAGQVRKSGEPYVEHPLAVAIILAHLRMDVDSLCAGLLHDTVIARTNPKKKNTPLVEPPYSQVLGQFRVSGRRCGVSVELARDALSRTNPRRPKTGI